MRLFVRLFVLFCLVHAPVVVRAQTVRPARPADVQQVLRYVRSHAEPTRLASWEKHPRDSMWRVSFVEGGKRYTIFAQGDKFGITFKVQPTGTALQASVEDVNGDIDGRVRMAIHGGGVYGKAADSSRRMIFESAEPSLGKYQSVGEQYRDYWQQQFNNAVSAALRFYQKQK